MPRNYTRRPLAERFWPKVERRGPDECWPWAGAMGSHGYGVIYLTDHPKRVDARAHRVAFFLTHGTWPSVVRHACDNPPCCNPAHLRGGTQTDNMRDMWAKGRGVRLPVLRGDDHPRRRR